MTKRYKISEDEILLPEPLIQHIQSFLTGIEAARTTVLSKSWYTAWLTRPTFDFDQRDFKNSDVQLPKIEFAQVITKSMQRYQDSNMKIDNFRLRLGLPFSYSYSYRRRMSESEILANKLIVSALKSGATELDLDLISTAFVLPPEMLESEQLVRLSLNMRTIDGNVRCRRLKSLSLHKVHLGSDDMIRDILSCCLLIEDLTLSFCTRPSSGIRKHRNKMIDLSGMNMYKFHKLRRLFLVNVRFDPLFFSDFGSRFPCLKDLSVSDCCCRWSEAIQIASTSLESMSFVKVTTLVAEFDVPNLVSFRYSGVGIPSLCIESTSSREWESHVSISTIHNACANLNSWYLRLNKLLTQLRSSKISLCISRRGFLDGDIKVVSKPIVVENLTFDLPYRPSGYTILSGLLSICRPKHLTIYWFTNEAWCSDDNNLCKRLMTEIAAPNSCETSNQNMFGQLGLKEASVDFEERPGGEWQPLLLNEQLDAPIPHEYKRRLRFRLRWG